MVLAVIHMKRRDQYFPPNCSIIVGMFSQQIFLFDIQTLWHAHGHPRQLFSFGCKALWTHSSKLLIRTLTKVLKAESKLLKVSILYF